MMNTYKEYKRWWLETQAQHYTDSLWIETEEELFKQHVIDLGFYGLMEILSDWDE